MKRLFLSFLPLLIFLILNAQGDMPSENNNWMSGHHKIFVVVAVLAIILTALFIFLFSIERRLKKLENNLSTNR